MKKGRLASFARSLAWAYVAALVAVVALLRLVGEDFWLLTPLLYLPRALFGLPLVLTLPMAAYAGPRWTLLAQVACGLLVLFPLMGLELHPLAGRATPETPKIRVMSFNVFFGRDGCDAIVDEVAAHDPDVVVMQATGKHCDRALAARFPAFHVEAGREFVLGSRFPVRDVFRPPHLAGPRAILPEFVRYTLETPLGPIDLFSMHPYSPRNAFEAVRGQVLGTPGEAEDEPHVSEGRAGVIENTSDRERQVAAVAAAAGSSTNPVIIAGDTNLPALSRIYARYLGLGPWKDGFASVGNGFGYTFPSRWRYGIGPWMRIDRILAGPQLRFLKLEVGGRDASDHCPVIAELGAR